MTTLATLCVLLAALCQLCLGARPPNCPVACPKQDKILLPVCATYNGRRWTFSSECVMQQFNCETNQRWRKLFEGECPVCDIVCLAVEMPVCATMNGFYRTFNNECYLKLYNCLQKENWLKVSDGSCRQRPGR